MLPQKVANLGWPIIVVIGLLRRIFFLRLLRPDVELRNPAPSRSFAGRRRLKRLRDFRRRNFRFRRQLGFFRRRHFRFWFRRFTSGLFFWLRISSDLFVLFDLGLGFDSILSCGDLRGGFASVAADVAFIFGFK